MKAFTVVDDVCLGERGVASDRKVVSVGWKEENRLSDGSANKTCLAVQCTIRVLTKREEVTDAPPRPSPFAMAKYYRETALYNFMSGEYAQTANYSSLTKS